MTVILTEAKHLESELLDSLRYVLKWIKNLYLLETDRGSRQIPGTARHHVV